MGVPLDNEGLIKNSILVTLVGTPSKLPAYHQMFATTSWYAIRFELRCPGLAVTYFTLLYFIYFNIQYLITWGVISYNLGCNNLGCNKGRTAPQVQVTTDNERLIRKTFGASIRSALKTTNS